MLGTAAVAIWCDVSAGMREEFDDWHAHEHMPERLSIPGFLRGTRWVGDEGRYFMLYEVRDEPVLTGPAYLERLNNPTAWSRKMMPHHGNMVRGLCRVEASAGRALGRALATVRFPGRLAADLPALAARKGLVAAHLLRNVAHASAETAEQKLRGGDRAPDGVLLVSGYDAAAAALAARELAPAVSVTGLYSLAYVLTA